MTVQGCPKKAEIFLRRFYNVTKRNKKGQFIRGNKPWHAGISMPLWYRKKLSEARLKSKFRTGKLHPRWKGGKIGYFNDIAIRVYKEHHINIICELCGLPNDIDIHHKDKNVKNNNIDNLQAVCHSCHSRIHWPEKRIKMLKNNPKTKNYIHKVLKLYKAGK